MKFPVILSGISIGFVICLLPSLAHAFDFYPLERGQVLEAGSAIYRLKPNQTSPQLAELPEGTTIKQSLKFNDRLIAVGQIPQTTEQFLVTSQDGLAWQKILSIEPATGLTMAIFHDQLFLRRQSASATELLTSSDGQVYTPTVITAPHGSPELDHLMWVDQKIVLAFQNGSSIDLFTLIGNVWQNAASISCPAAQVFHQPVDFLFCQDGRVLVPQTTSQWLNLFAISVTKPSVSADLIVASAAEVESALPQLAVWQKGQTQTWLITSQKVNPITALSVSGLRILVRFTARGWYELLWQPIQPEFHFLTDQSTAIPVETANNPRLFISSGIGGLYSDESGQWQSLTADGGFNHAYRVSDNWLVWQTNETHTDGGMMQLATNTAPGTFKRVTHPWSQTTSPIQAVYLDTGISYVAVVTNHGTGNLNLYKSLNNVVWKRVTLPTDITFVRSPAGARLLAEGSLVESRAVIRVKPGVVNAETLYIQDQTGGIQVFLDSSSGQLPDSTGQEVFATGTISSSQTKRIIIDDPTAIETISQNNPDPDWLTITPIEVTDHQGQVVWLRGEVLDVQTDWLTLGAGGSTFKIHVMTGTKPVKGDTIKILAVIDWNSASAAVEGWALDNSFVVVNHPSPSPTPTVQPSPSPSPSTTPTAQPSTGAGGGSNSSGTSSSKSSPSKATKTTVQPQIVLAKTAQPNLVAALTSELPSNGVPTSAGASQNPLTTLFLLASSLVTGLLIGQGWRIRRLFDRTDTS